MTTADMTTETLSSVEADIVQTNLIRGLVLGAAAVLALIAAMALLVGRICWPR